MKNTRYMRLAAAAISLIASGAVMAATATVTTTTGSTFNATSLYEFQTYGGNIGRESCCGNMDGMLVTVTYANGGQETQVWNSTTAYAGAATSRSWSLVMDGNTNWGPWVFTNTGDVTVTGLQIEGRPGMTVFDYVLGSVGSEGTPTSSYGGNPTSFNSHFPQGVEGASDLVVAATYTDQLYLNGVFYGDLYTTLKLNFSGTTGSGRTGVSSGEVVKFASDTDNIREIPEPATLGLLGLGIIGLGAMSRRRRS